MARLQQPVADKSEFERLDNELLAALHNAHINAKDWGLGELANPAVFISGYDSLMSALNELGGMEGVEANMNAAAETLGPLLQMKTKARVVRPSLKDQLLLEVMRWQDLCAERQAASSLDALGTAAVVDLPRCHPAHVLRHATLRVEWQRVFGDVECVPWREFHQSMLTVNAAAWGLERHMDKYALERLRKRLVRGVQGRLSLVGLDFAFNPGFSISATVSSLQQTGGTGSNSAIRSVVPGSPYKEPHVNMHNFPEVCNPKP